MEKIRHKVFWPTFLFMCFIVAFNIFYGELFYNTLRDVKSFILINFGWVYSLGSLLMVFVCIYVYFSPIGNKKIGGENAIPLLSTWTWFTIALCTTIAAGMIFWSAAEPIYHIAAPPEFLGIEPNSQKAATFAISTMFMHWTITPYAIYCVPALMFALVYYNMKKPFSFTSCLIPAIGEKNVNRSASTIDSICLFTTLAGMSASLGTGILSVSGGISHIFSIESTPTLWIWVGLFIVTVFILSASSGLMRGIKILSELNVKVFFALITFIFLVGPTAYMCNLGVESLGVYLDTFFTKNLVTGSTSESTWTHFWTVAYFGSWMAWAPITSLFLGKISYGHTVRKFILINLLIPSVFTMIWISIVGGASLHIHTNTQDLYQLILNEGTEKVIYTIFNYLPLAILTIPILVFITFISFVTAADSTTNAMASLCYKGSPDKISEPPIGLKIVWGSLIGFIAIIMITGEGIGGVKMLSAFGGFPATVLIILSGYSLFKVARNPNVLK